jgi:diphthamide biosynthesis protein 4
MATKNFYEILNVEPNASAEEIKKSYQRLVMLHHPDKSTATATTDANAFLELDEAWKVLRDADARKVYDAELFQQDYETNPIIHETLTTGQFEYDPESESFCHGCRCGGNYVLPDFDENECLISCDECSLVIEVVKNGENT